MKPTYDELVTIFKSKKIKLTDVRMSMLKFITSKEHVTINDIFDYVEKDLGSVNVMSIYNNIDLMLGEHLLFANTFNGKTITYEAVTPESIHVKCDHCGTVTHHEMLNNNEVTTEFSKIAKEQGIELEHFKVEIHGICNNCKKNAQ